MNERDILTEKKYAREEGIKEGTTRIALNLKKAGVDITMISHAIGLSIEQIEAL